MVKQFKNEAEALKFVEEQIKAHKVVVFSKSYCPYCVRAKELLEELKANAFAIELDLMDGDDGDLVQAALKTKTKQSTVPNIFINGKHIGGCDDTFKLHKSGKLAALL